MTTDHSGRPYVLISGDSHGGADLLDYKPYLESALHDAFDAWAGDFQEDAWGKIDDQLEDSDPGLRFGVSSFGSPYNWEGDKRLAHMDDEGIAAELIFPNTVPPFYPRSVINASAPGNSEEYRLRWAGVKAHNRWMADFCAESPYRRGGVAQVFIDNIDDAIAEVQWAKDAGMKCVLIPADHSLKLVNLYERRLDPFWAVCAELDMPVNRHAVFVGPPETEETGPATDAIGIHECTPFFRRGLSHLMLGGVFERFPSLKFIFTETQAWWVPSELQTLDAEVRMANTKGTSLYPLMHRAVEGLSKSPSEYFKHGVWIGTSLMTHADIECRHQVGVDRLIWGSDYPHHEGSYPNTRLSLRWNFSEVPEAEVRAMTSVNAANVYGFDLDHLQTIADKIGPSPEELATPVTAEELPEFSLCGSIQEAIGSIRA